MVIVQILSKSVTNSTNYELLSSRVQSRLLISSTFSCLFCKQYFSEQCLKLNQSIREIDCIHNEDSNKDSIELHVHQTKISEYFIIPTSPQFINNTFKLISKKLSSISIAQINEEDIIELKIQKNYCLIFYSEVLYPHFADIQLLYSYLPIGWIKSSNKLIRLIKGNTTFDFVGFNLKLIILDKNQTFAAITLFIDKYLPDFISNYDYLGEAMVKERGKKGLYLFYNQFDLEFNESENTIRQTLRTVAQQNQNWQQIEFQLLLSANQPEYYILLDNFGILPFNYQIPLFLYESNLLHTFKDYNYLNQSIEGITTFIRECDEEQKHKYYNSQQQRNDRRHEEESIFQGRLQKIVSDDLDNLKQTRTPFLVEIYFVYYLVNCLFFTL